MSAQANQMPSWPNDFPHEITLKVFTYVTAHDLASLSRVCWTFHSCISHNSSLWKNLYLMSFDTPSRTPSSWAEAVQSLMRFQKLLSSQGFEQTRENTAFLGSQILPLMLSTVTSPPRKNISFLRPLFNHDCRQTSASTLLRQSSLFRRCGMPFDIPADSPFTRQLSARLHVYSGLPLELRESECKDVEGAHWLHPYARSRVYDMRRYKRLQNGWGPFMDDKSWRVDWEKVQAIWLVLGYGLRMISERHNGNILQVLARCIGVGINADEHMWQGLAPGSYSAVTTDDKSNEKESDAATAGDSESDDDLGQPADDGVPPIEFYERKYNHDLKEAEAQRQQALFALEDPYGVTGTWIRVVNFLDYHDLYALNFRSAQDLPDHIEREPVQTAEAFRLILLHLWITKIEWPEEDEFEQDREVERPTRSRSQQARELRALRDMREGTPSSWTTVSDATDDEASNPTTRPEQGLQAEDAGTGQASRNDRSSSTNSDDLYHKPTHASSSTSPTANSSQAGQSPNHRSPINAAADKGKALAVEAPEPGKKRVRWPKVHFEGRSSSLHMRWDANANSLIQGSDYYDVIGYVQARQSKPVPEHELRNDEGINLSHIFPWVASGPDVMPNGLHADDDLVIRWTTHSIVDGTARWRSEGIQIGGLKSARGILGNWFDKDWDMHGPAGPTGFWKVSDNFQRYPKARIRRDDFDDDSD